MMLTYSLTFSTFRHEIWEWMLNPFPPRQVLMLSSINKTSERSSFHKHTHAINTKIIPLRINSAHISSSPVLAASSSSPGREHPHMSHLPCKYKYKVTLIYLNSHVFFFLTHMQITLPTQFTCFSPSISCMFQYFPEALP